MSQHHPLGNTGGTAGKHNGPHLFHIIPTVRRQQFHQFPAGKNHRHQSPEKRRPPAVYFLAGIFQKHHFRHNFHPQTFHKSTAGDHVPEFGFGNSDAQGFSAGGVVQNRRSMVAHLDPQQNGRGLHAVRQHHPHIFAVSGTAFTEIAAHQDGPHQHDPVHGGLPFAAAEFTDALGKGGPLHHIGKLGMKRPLLRSGGQFRFRTEFGKNIA